MSRQLPSTPNLEFLKKQAKELLATMRPAQLSAAQHALAKDYGFPTWAKLKAHVVALARTPAERLQAAICDQDAAATRALLDRHPELRASLDAPLPTYGQGQHALFAAVQRSDRATIDLLLAAGANINQRTHSPAGGFGVLDDCDPALFDFLTARGALLDPHSAARLGKSTELEHFIAADPAVVHARGADGRTPLHCASTIEIAQFLLDHGADIDALDTHYQSTPAQHMLRVEHKRHYPIDRQNIARFLVSQGCRTDLLMAAALGDAALVRRHLDADPDSIHLTVPATSVYLPLLGKNRTAHTVARDFGHEDIFQLLLERTPPALRLALACELGDETAFHELLAHRPALTAEDWAKLPNAAQSNNTPAVRLMLQAGWPVDTPGEMGATALHWAAFNGNAAMVRAILPFHPAIEQKSQEYAGTALSWAIFGSGNSWHSDTGDYPGAVQALLEAGATPPDCPEDLEPSDAVLALLEIHSA